MSEGSGGVQEWGSAEGVAEQRAVRGSFGIRHLTYRSAHGLQQSFLPFVHGGGLFLFDEEAGELGDLVFLVIDLPGKSEPLAVLGKVVWIAPRSVVGQQPFGFGLQFQDQQDAARLAIEQTLAQLPAQKEFTFMQHKSR